MRYTDTDERGRRGLWHEDTNHCPGCSKEYKSGDDLYCRYCGTKTTGEKVRWFEPSPDYTMVLYGPCPATLFYTCEKCGNRWTSSNWDQQHFCPKCGSRVTDVEERE